MPAYRSAGAPSEARKRPSDAPGVGVPDSCELPNVGAGIQNVGPLEKQQAVLITEPEIKYLKEGGVDDGCGS